MLVGTRRVLALLVAGLDRDQAASHLGRTPRAVEGHLRRARGGVRRRRARQQLDPVNPAPAGG